MATEIGRFSCGATDHSGELEANNDFVLIHIHRILELDLSIERAADLPSGWSAEREDAESPWRRYPDPT